VCQGSEVFVSCTGTFAADYGGLTSVCFRIIYFWYTVPKILTQSVYIHKWCLILEVS